jgi:hypothetical protein
MLINSQLEQSVQSVVQQKPDPLRPNVGSLAFAYATKSLLGVILFGGLGLVTAGYWYLRSVPLTLSGMTTLALICGFTLLFLCSPVIAYVQSYRLLSRGILAQGEVISSEYLRGRQHVTFAITTGQGRYNAVARLDQRWKKHTTLGRVFTVLSLRRFPCTAVPLAQLKQAD